MPPVEGSNLSRSVRVTFTASSSTVVLAWGGHAGSELDWGPNDFVGSSTGSSYHMRLIDVDGSGGNQDRSIQVGAIFPVPTNKSTTASASVINVGGSVTDTARFTGSPDAAGTRDILPLRAVDRAPRLLVWWLATRHSGDDERLWLCDIVGVQPDSLVAGRLLLLPRSLHAGGQFTVFIVDPYQPDYRMLRRPLGSGPQTQVSQSSITSGSVTDTATLTQSGQLGVVNGTVTSSSAARPQSAPDCSTGGTAVGGAVSVSSGSAQPLAAFTPTTSGIVLLPRRRTRRRGLELSRRPRTRTPRPSASSSRRRRGCRPKRVLAQRPSARP